jgi:hypothetical protein
LAHPPSQSLFQLFDRNPSRGQRRSSREGMD